MIHKVVARSENEVEYPVCAVAVGGLFEIERIGDISEAAGVDLTVSDDDRVLEIFVGGVCVFAAVNADIFINIYLELISVGGREALGV